MLAKRIIPCLDVKDGQVVKGIKFRDHQPVGGILELVKRYAKDGADELVFYDIGASPDDKTVASNWVSQITELLDIPFTVAGGIRSIKEAGIRLESGADKISINTPALQNPGLIDDLVKNFGTQCVVIGIDSLRIGREFEVFKFTGCVKTVQPANRKTVKWVKEVIDRGAGEIVLNCMDRDGVRTGFDLCQLAEVRRHCDVPLIASGGAGAMEHFADVFEKADVDGALAASVFHKSVFSIPDLKKYLYEKGTEVRLP